MKIAIYPGSFDPITKGHLDVLVKAAEMFDKVIIAVLKNNDKKGFLPIDDRVALIKEAAKGLENVEVDSFDGLTIDYAHQKGANILIRGLRAVSDFEYEMQMSQMNNALAPDITTVFLITRPKFSFISSSTIKEIAFAGGNVEKFVPECVVKYFCDNIKEKGKR